MALTLADSDALIDYLTGAGPVADAVAEEIENSTLATTALARFELLAAATPGRQETQVRQLLYAIMTLPINDEVADKAVESRRMTVSPGHELTVGQSLTAATAIVNSARLLTGTRNIYEGVPNLRLWGF